VAERAICGGLDPGNATRVFIPGEVHKHFIPLILIHAAGIQTTAARYRKILSFSSSYAALTGASNS